VPLEWKRSRSGSATLRHEFRLGSVAETAVGLLLLWSFERRAANQRASAESLELWSPEGERVKAKNDSSARPYRRNTRTFYRGCRPEYLCPELLPARIRIHSLKPALGREYEFFRIFCRYPSCTAICLDSICRAFQSLFATHAIREVLNCAENVVGSWYTSPDLHHLCRGEGCHACIATTSVPAIRTILGSRCCKSALGLCCSRCRLRCLCRRHRRNLLPSPGNRFQNQRATARRSVMDP
jgi:hypothetical protein